MGEAVVDVTLTANSTIYCRFNGITGISAINSNIVTVEIITPLFYDSGILGTANENYTLIGGNINKTVTATGTTITGTVSSDTYYKPNVSKNLTNWSIEFTYLGHSETVFGFVFRNTNNTNKFFMEGWEDSSGMLIDFGIGSQLKNLQAPTVNTVVKFTFENGLFKVYYDDVLQGQNNGLPTGEGYLSFKFYRNRGTTFRDFIINEL